MKPTSAKLIAQNTMIAALYIVLTLINPISSGAFQFRISTLLMAVPFFFPNMSYGLVAGVMISNFFTGFGIIDVFGGFIIQSLSLFVYNRLTNNHYLKSFGYAVTAGLVVAAVIYIAMNLPFGLTGYLTSAFIIFVPNFIMAVIGVFVVDKYLKPVLAKSLG